MRNEFSRRRFMQSATAGAAAVGMAVCGVAAVTADVASDDSSLASPFSIREIRTDTDAADGEAGGLELTESGYEKPVFVYRYAEQRRPDIRDPRNRRACYLHPVYGLSGEMLTDDFPDDHYHHHGIFWGWMHIRFDGMDCEYDNWTHPETLQFHHMRWLERSVSANRAVIAAENRWALAENPDDSLCRETIRLTVYPTMVLSGEPGSDSIGAVRVIDFEGTWTPTGRAMTLRGAEGKSYGGVNIRFAPHRVPTITVLDGVTKEDLTVTRLEWADFTAGFMTSEAEPTSVLSGVTLIAVPDHPDYPPTWLTRHYGVLCVGWPGVEGRTFADGETFTLRYRFLIHRDPLSPEQLVEAISTAAVRRAYP